MRHLSIDSSVTINSNSVSRPWCVLSIVAEEFVIVSFELYSTRNPSDRFGGGVIPHASEMRFPLLSHRLQVGPRSRTVIPCSDRNLGCSPSVLFSVSGLAMQIIW